MRLKSNAVNTDAIVLEEFNNVLTRGIGFVADCFDAVVVVVQLCVGVRGCSGAEGDFYCSRISTAF